MLATIPPTTPVDITYQLTPKGRALGEAVAAISRWAEAWEDPEQHT